MNTQIFYFNKSSKVTKVHPILPLTQPFAYWMVRWCFPLQIVCISLYLYLSLTLHLVLSPSFAPCKHLYTERSHKATFMSRSFWKLLDLYIKLQPWHTFLWTTFVPVSLSIYLFIKIHIFISLYLYIHLNICLYLISIYSRRKYHCYNQNTK